jgi:hypothetical protein
MLQAFVSNASFVLHTYVASVFIWILHMFYIYIVSFLFVASVFIWILHMFHIYVVSFLFECCVRLQ